MLPALPAIKLGTPQSGSYDDSLEVKALTVFEMMQQVRFATDISPASVTALLVHPTPISTPAALESFLNVLSDEHKSDYAAYAEKNTFLPHPIHSWMLDEASSIHKADFLNLANQGLLSLPVEITRLKNLTHLNLSGNPLVCLPDGFDDLNLTILDLTGCRLRHVPEEVFGLTGLKTLYLGTNFLREISPAIQNLAALKELNLNNNLLGTLPLELGMLPNVKALHLTHNQFTDFPMAVCRLKELEHLHISENQLDLLPHELRRCSALKVLDLSFNNFCFFPRSALGLLNLVQLSLGGNKLAFIPEGLKNLEHLLFLDLSANKFTTLPRDLVDLVHLDDDFTLILDNNPAMERASLN